MPRDNFPWWWKEKRCWYVWHAGKQVRLSPDKEEALRMWHQLAAGAAGEGASREEPGLTVAALVDAYLDAVKDRLKPSTMNSKRKVLLRLKKERGSTIAEDFSPEVAVVWIKAQAGWGPSKQWLAACVMKTCFRWAVTEKGLLTRSPIAGLKMGSPRSRGSSVLVSPEDHARLLEVAPLVLRNVLTGLRATGCRPCELCAVEARDFDAEQGVWILARHKTEATGKARIVYLTPELVTLCRELAEKYPHGPLFRNTKGEPMTPERLRNWLFKTCRRLGMKRVLASGYRHGFATDALANGVPDAQVAELLGHSGTFMLHRHYAHLTARAKTLKEALGKVRE